VTVGTWNRDDFIPITAGWKGVKWTRSWNGADRPKVNRYGDWETYVVKRGDNTYRFRKRRLWVGSPPLKRDYDVDHVYAMDESYRSDEEVRFVMPGGGYSAPTSLMGVFGATTWAPVVLLTANDQLKLLSKLREKMMGSDFNLSVFLGEGHQTLGMIADTAIRIAKSLHHLRKGDLAGTARSLLEGTSRAPIKPYKSMKPFKPTAERMSSHWLELQYGWLPLLNDAEAGAQALAHQLQTPLQQTYRMSVRRESRVVRTVSAGVMYPSTALSVRTHSRSHKVIVSEHPSFMAKLGLTNPELVAWELLPFSFVADWFIPIGSYLEARAITSAVVARYVSSDKTTGIAYTPISQGFDRKPRATFRAVSFTRSLHATPPEIPLPKFKSLSSAASWQHCANAVALVTQFATGGKVRK
jgi:hypothetical protein